MGTPKSLLAASADSRRVVDSAVISKSSASDLRAGMCACAAHPRSGLAPMMPTRILWVPFFRMVTSLLQRWRQDLAREGLEATRLLAGDLLDEDAGVVTPVRGVGCEVVVHRPVDPGRGRL